MADLGKAEIGAIAGARVVAAFDADNRIRQGGGNLVGRSVFGDQRTNGMLAGRGCPRDTGKTEANRRK